MADDEKVDAHGNPKPKKRGKSKKDKRRSRPHKLPNKIVVIKNTDKDVGNWMENWKAPKRRSIAHIPHPFRMLALGGVGRGKSNTLKNIILVHQQSDRPFKEMYVCCCDISSTEWLDMDPTAIMDVLPNTEQFNPKTKTVLVIDDFEFEKANKDTMRQLSTLFRYVSSHRNLSILCGYQSFFDTPSIARKCANVYLIYKPNSRQELTSIANRVGLDSDDIRHIFNTVCSGIYDSLMIDKTIGTPYPLRKNVYEPITTTGGEQLEDLEPCVVEDKEEIIAAPAKQIVTETPKKGEGIGKAHCVVCDCYIKNMTPHLKTKKHKKKSEAQ